MSIIWNILKIFFYAVCGCIGFVVVVFVLVVILISIATANYKKQYGDMYDFDEEDKKNEEK